MSVPEGFGNELVDISGLLPTQQPDWAFQVEQDDRLSDTSQEHETAQPLRSSVQALTRNSGQLGYRQRMRSALRGWGDSRTEDIVQSTSDGLSRAIPQGVVPRNTARDYRQEDIDQTLARNYERVERHLNTARRPETDSFAELREAGARLAQVNEDLRTLLERPLFEVVPEETAHQDAEDEGQGRRKRRRLDRDKHEEEIPTINYGRLGQVSPGPLTMQIHSCDGGTLDSHMPQPFLGRQGHKYAPENVLRDDDNLVYCTQKSRCNLVLQHRGETLFDLERLVIKAPEKTRYTDP